MDGWIVDGNGDNWVEGERENKWDRVSERRCLARVAHANRRKTVLNPQALSFWGPPLGLVRGLRRMAVWHTSICLSIKLIVLFLLFCLPSSSVHR